MSTKTRPRLSLSSQVVLGLVAGVVVGISVGEMAAFLQTVGKAFILLLQMTLLPYITLSLITGLGHLSYQEVKILVLKVGGLLLGPLCVHRRPRQREPIGEVRATAASFAPLSCEIPFEIVSL